MMMQDKRRAEGEAAAGAGPWRFVCFRFRFR